MCYKNTKITKEKRVLEMCKGMKSPKERIWEVEKYFKDERKRDSGEGERERE